MSAYNSNAMADLFDAAGAAGRASIDRDRARRADRELQREYAIALENAKQTGELADRFQRQVGVDMLVTQVGIKVVALRELGKKAPEHPLIASQECRDLVGKGARIAYNRADRPNTDVNAFAPDEDLSQKIFQRCKKI